MFAKHDNDGSGALDHQEFVAAVRAECGEDEATGSPISGSPISEHICEPPRPCTAARYTLPTC